MFKAFFKQPAVNPGVQTSQILFVRQISGTPASSAPAKKPLSPEFIARKKLRVLPPTKAPKSPLSAYASFVKDNFDKVSKTYDGPSKLKGSTTMSKIAELWSSSPESVKAPYFELAKRGREAYVRALKSYEENMTPIQLISEIKRRNLLKVVRRKVVKPPADPNRPTRPISSYMRFITDLYAAGPTVQKDVLGVSLDSIPTISDRGRKLGEAWKSLPPQRKQVYVEQASRELESYKEAIAEYDDQVNAKQIRKDLERDLNRAAKPPTKPKRKKAAARKPLRKTTGSRRKILKKPVVKKVVVKKPLKKTVAKKTVAKKVVKKVGAKTVVKKSAKKVAKK